MIKYSSGSVTGKVIIHLLPSSAWESLSPSSSSPSPKFPFSLLTMHEHRISWPASPLLEQSPIGSEGWSAQTGPLCIGHGGGEREHMRGLAEAVLGVGTCVGACVCV